MATEADSPQAAGGADKKGAEPEPEVRHDRYEAKEEADGSALAPEREEMFDDLRDVGVSGSQGGTTGREDQNPIGPEKR